jgi:hypothetical protein
MSKVHGKGAVVKIDDLGGTIGDISSAIIGSKHSPNVDHPNTTCFGARGVRREVIGLTDGDVIPINGFYTRVAGTKVHGKGAAALMDQYDMSAFFKGINLKNNITLDDTNTFGQAYKARDVPGLLDASADCQGFYDPAANASWPMIRASLAAASVIFSFAPEGWAIGNLVEMGKGVFTGTDVPLDVDKVVPVSAKTMADDGWDLGVCLHALASEAVATNSASVDETAGTANGGVGHLHVTAFVSGTATVKIQHSTDNSVWNDLITFTAVTSVTKERIELAAGTTVNRYVRVITSGTFSITFTAAFGRRSYTYGTVGTYRHFRGLLGQATSATYMLGPSGSTTGLERITGESRLRSIDLSLNNEQVVTFSGELICTGTVTYDTWP